MYSDLIVNLSLIISFLFVAGQIFKEKSIHSTITNRVMAGLLSGILGIILMMYTINITDTLIMDLRHFGIFLAALYGGALSSIIAGFLISLGRIFIFGIHIPSIVGCINIVFLVIACTFIIKMKSSNFQKMFYMNVCSIIITSIAFIMLIEDLAIQNKVLLYYGIISLVGGPIIFYISDYIDKSNINFRLLKESSTKDFLTGLNNVRQFDISWNNHVKNSKEKNEFLSLLLIDIDHFKRINDTYGHLVGDIILRELGKKLLGTTRSFDTVSRNGGEEFSVILPDCPYQQAISIAEKIRHAVEQHEFAISDGESIHITISIGVASYPENVNNLELIIHKADQSLYKAKNSGRNMVCS